MARRLNFEVSCSRICEFEHGTREPNLMVLLRYSEVARVHMETLVDDLITSHSFVKHSHGENVQGEHMAQYDAC